MDNEIPKVQVGVHLADILDSLTREDVLKMVCAIYAEDHGVGGFAFKDLDQYTSCVNMGVIWAEDFSDAIKKTLEEVDRCFDIHGEDDDCEDLVEDCYDDEDCYDEDEDDDCYDDEDESDYRCSAKQLVNRLKNIQALQAMGYDTSQIEG